MPKVVIPTPLRQYVGKQETIELKAATVGELLTKLVTEHGNLRRHLYTDDGRLRSFVNVYVNDEDIRYLQKENTAVKDTDVVSIVPSIAGGSALVGCHSERSEESHLADTQELGPFATLRVTSRGKVQLEMKGSHE